MSSSLNSLKGVIRGIIYGTTIGVIKGDTRSLDYGSYVEQWPFGLYQGVLGYYFTHFRGPGKAYDAIPPKFGILGCA